MRIALIQTKLVWAGGIERFLSSVLPRLGKENDVALFTFRLDPEVLPEAHGYMVHVVTGRASLLGRFRAYFKFRLLYNLLSELKTWRPDIVIVQLPEAVRLANWLSLHLKSTPVIPYVHDLWTLSMIRRLDAYHEEELQKTGRFKAWYLRVVSGGAYETGNLGRAGPVICVSQSIQSHVSEFWKEVETRVIYNGVDHDYFMPTWEDDGYALCVSRIDKTKSLDLILDGFRDATYPVIICGNVQRDNLETDSYVQEVLLSAKGSLEVRLNQDQAMIKRLIQKSSLFLQPDKEEGSGLFTLEGMACGKPIIAHKSGEAVEVVNGGGIFLGDDVDEWRRTADELMSSSRARRELGEKALAQSMKFDWDRTSLEIDKVCGDLAAKHGPEFAIKG